MRSPSKLSHISRLELVESLDADDVDLKSGYMSDSDLMGKTMTEDDDITTGWVPQPSRNTIWLFKIRLDVLYIVIAKADQNHIDRLYFCIFPPLSCNYFTGRLVINTQDMQ